MTELHGITWNHTRGYLPLVATAQRFSELHPNVQIHWSKRSLQEFADLSLDCLAGEFDLLVIDHPFVGLAAESGVLLPLDEHLPEPFLSGQAAQSVGKSHESYCFGGYQWALAIDAATPISGYRRDLLEMAGAPVPKTWMELLELGRRGLVAFPGIALDTLMHLYMLCIGLGEEPFSQPERFAPVAVVAQALEMLRELAGLVSPECAWRNPIATWELLTASDAVAFCPFAYGYSNYSRTGYAEHAIEAGGLIRIEDDTCCRSTLGGAGLAISARCREIDLAAEYSCFTAGPECQTRLYFESGGQPGHRSAWLDDEVNCRSHNFFRNTLATLDEAWLRPRWNGYLAFQEKAAAIVHPYIWGGGKAETVATRLNQIMGDVHETT